MMVMSLAYLWAGKAMNDGYIYSNEIKAQVSSPKVLI